MRHIVHLINALRIGGAETLLITLSGELQRRGMPLTIITLRANDPAVKQKALAAGGRVVEFPARKIRNLSRFQALLRFLREAQPDLMHTHLTMANIIGQAAGWRLGIPTVTTLHNVRMRSRQHAGQHRLESWLLDHRAAAVVAVGQSVARAHHGRLPNQALRVIPNAVPPPGPVDPAERLRLREELTDGHPQRPLLLAIGRLEQQKAFSDLLAAHAQHLQSHPETHLAIAGEGPQRALLAQQIQSLGTSERVKLLGRRHDVPALLAAADLYVNSSHWEGLPVSLLEALAAGRPVIATRVGDVPQVIDERCGIVLEPGDPAALAAALNRLIACPQARQAMGAAALEKTAGEFSAAVWVDRLLALYEKVLEDR